MRAHERTAEWRSEQLESVLARAGLALPDWRADVGEAQRDSSAPPSDADSPGSWWGPHEGGWIKSDASRAPATPSVNGKGGVSPSSSGGTGRDSTDWGQGYAGWHAYHPPRQHPHALQASGQLARGSAAGGGRGGIALVSAEAADDWHHQVRLRAKATMVPPEVSARPEMHLGACAP